MRTGMQLCKERDFLIRAYLRDMAYLFISGESYFVPLVNAKQLYRGGI